jgi:hypothetical protein
LSEYGINNALKSGLQNKCKTCLSGIWSSYRSTEVFKNKRKQKRNLHSENIQKRKKYSEMKKTNPAEYNKIKQERKKYAIIYRQKIKGDEQKQILHNQTKNNWEKNKMRNDIFYKTYRSFKANFKNRIEKNGNKTFSLLSYSFDDFINRIGSKTQGYHLDHKIPVSWFKEFDPNIIYNLDNLHWITADENLKKKNTYSHPVPISYWEIAKPFLKDQYISRFEYFHKCVIDTSFS